MPICESCIHNRICIIHSATNCVHFTDKETVIALPCRFDEKKFHVTKCGAIVEVNVVGIHFERKLRHAKGEKYIVMRSVDTGYISDKMSFEQYVRDVFPTRQQAAAEAERRKVN